MSKQTRFRKYSINKVEGKLDNTEPVQDISHQTNSSNNSKTLHNNEDSLGLDLYNQCLGPTYVLMFVNA